MWEIRVPAALVWTMLLYSLEMWEIIVPTSWVDFELFGRTNVQSYIECTSSYTTLSMLECWQILYQDIHYQWWKVDGYYTKMYTQTYTLHPTVCYTSECHMLYMRCVPHDMLYCVVSDMMHCEVSVALQPMLNTMRHRLKGRCWHLQLSQFCLSQVSHKVIRFDRWHTQRIRSVDVRRVMDQNETFSKNEWNENDKSEG